jgi:hypothetical protein
MQNIRNAIKRKLSLHDKNRKYPFLERGDLLIACSNLATIRSY